MDDSYIVTAAGLHLRSEPNAESTIVLSMPHGQIVKKLEDASGDWWKVSTHAHLNVQTGYVSSHYLCPESEPTPKPAATGKVNVSKEQLLRLFPHACSSILDPIMPVINDMLAAAGISENSKRLSYFLAQVGTESAGLSAITENLHYSAKRLCAVWPREFKSIQFAEQYAENPEKLGDYIYANRLGNGNVASGDGYRFRGRGLFQLTGRANYAHFGSIIGMDLTQTPDQAATPVAALNIAVKYWQAEKMNELADQDNLRKITRLINGGYNGLALREAYYKHARLVFG
jgi:putative chitinase